MPYAVSILLFYWQSAFTAELQRRISEDHHITCYSVHPGAVITNVARSLPAILLWIYRNILKIVLLNVDEGWFLE